MFRSCRFARPSSLVPRASSRWCRGVTFIELLVVSGIVVIVASALFLVMTSGQTSWFMNDAVVEAQQEARRAIHEISRDLRSSGNENNVPRVRVHATGDGTGQCPMLAYQVPIDADTATTTVFDVENDGSIRWGAEDPMTGLLNGGVIWVHRADNSDGSGNVCTGTLLVRQVFTTANWPGGVSGGLPNLNDGDPSDDPVSTRVLARNVSSLETRALQGNGAAVSWTVGASNWTDDVKQVEVLVGTNVISVMRPTMPVNSVQMMRVRLRNTTT